MKTVVIGGSAAGMSMAAKLIRECPSEEIVVFEKSQEVSIGACGLPYYISGENDDLNKMRIRTVEQFKKMGIDVRIRHEAIAIDVDKQTITVKNQDEKETFEYDRLVIATGASPIVPNIEGKRLTGVFTLKTLEDAQTIKQFSSSIEDVTIVGGGYIGLELVEAFKHQNKKVRVIERLPRILSTFDEEFSHQVSEYLSSIDVDIQCNQSVKGIYPTESGKLRIKTDNHEFETQMVILAVGIQPNTAFMMETGIAMLSNKAIITDEKMRTSIKNLYAAGDCATVKHQITSQDLYIPLGTNANKQGKILAEILAGEDKEFTTALGSTMIKIVDLEVAKTGISMQEQASYPYPLDSVTITGSDHAHYYPDPSNITIKLVFDKQTKVIVGAQLIGRKNVALRLNPFVVAISQKMTASEFGVLDFGYAPPFASAWDVMHIAANVIK